MIIGCSSKSVRVIKLSFCKNDHFGKMIAWSLIYFLNYSQLSYLAQSQILVISLYCLKRYWRSTMYIYVRKTFTVFIIIAYIPWIWRRRFPAIFQFIQDKIGLAGFDGGTAAGQLTSGDPHWGHLTCNKIWLCNQNFCMPNYFCLIATFEI